MEAINNKAISKNLKEKYPELREELKNKKGIKLLQLWLEKNTDKIDDVIRVRGKHEKYRWISEEEVEKFDEPAINDFKDTLKKVFTMWYDIFKEK